MTENKNIEQKSNEILSYNSVRVIVKGGLIFISWILLYLFVMFGNPDLVTHHIENASTLVCIINLWLLSCL